MKRSILLDFTKCIGCKACMDSCREQNGLPEPDETDLSYRNYTVVLRKEKTFYRRMCMHCLQPACASACPVVALEKTQDGPVIYHPERCMGCRYCMVACPFKVPKYEWPKVVPVVRKCIFCFERLEAGGVPACAWVCPTGATRFGDRDVLIERARGRIRAHPDRYVPHIYGEKEVGGTSILMISGVPHEALGFPGSAPDGPLPGLTWTVLSKIPNISITWGLVMGGLWWIINRRTAIEAEHADVEDRAGNDGGGRGDGAAAEEDSSHV